MGRKPGYHHSEETKARIAESVSKAATGSPAAVKRYIKKATAILEKAAPQVDMAESREVAPEGRQRDSMPSPAVAAPRDALDALVAGPVKDIVALMLWKNRFNEPELSMQITERDLSAFKACCDYLGVVPEVRIVRPQGLPGHEAIPATRTRSAIPAAEPTPPKNYVSITLVERGTQDAIRPVESDQDGWNAAQEAKNFAHARDNALRLAAELQTASATGNYSSSTLDEAAKCLAALAR